MTVAALEYASLAIFYSLLAAALLESLLRVWKVKDPILSTSFRLVALTIPPLAPPLFALVQPIFGPGEWRESVALLSLHRWLGVEPSMTHPGWLLLILVMIGTASFVTLSESLGLLRHRSGGKEAKWQELARPLPRVVAKAAAAVSAHRARPLPVAVLDQKDPVAFTEGLRNPRVVLTTGLAELLDAEELEGVLAHEMAHVHRRDNGLGWLLFLLRLVSFYNPVALFTFHQISHDTEKICDTEAAAVTGKPLALASALIKVYRATYIPVGEGSGLLRPIAHRAVKLENHARSALVLDRAERLVRPESIHVVTYPGLRMWLAVVGVLLLMWLVV